VWTTHTNAPPNHDAPGAASHCKCVKITGSNTIFGLNEYGACGAIPYERFWSTDTVEKDCWLAVCGCTSWTCLPLIPCFCAPDNIYGCWYDCDYSYNKVYYYTVECTLYRL
jgi:hypothetical protein